MVHLDFGTSYRTGLPVTQEILSRFPATLELTLAAMAFMVLVALPAGVLSALYRHAFIDHLTRLFALIGASMPGFWKGLLLIYLFAVVWGLLPVMGRAASGILCCPRLPWASAWPPCTRVLSGPACWKC